MEMNFHKTTQTTFRVRYNLGESRREGDEAVWVLERLLSVPAPPCLIQHPTSRDEGSGWGVDWLGMVVRIQLQGSGTMISSMNYVRVSRGSEGGGGARGRDHLALR